MSRTLVAVCFVLAMVSACYADATPRPGATVIGNWEPTDPTPGWSIDGTAAYMEVDSGVSNSLGPCATMGNNSLLLAVNGGTYWPIVWTAPWDNDAQRNKVPTIGPGCLFSFDITVLASDEVGWEDMGEKISINSDGPSGYQEYTPTCVNRADNTSTGHDWGSWTGDLARTYTYNVGGYNETGATWMIIKISYQGWPATAYIDNVEICPEPATMALLGLGGLALIRRKK
ncbi:MAG: PEP-CTERM sorting domain-containing protein [Sedimentisphaerales bacterium]|jgi:hypothetical protein